VWLARGLSLYRRRPLVAINTKSAEDRLWYYGSLAEIFRFRMPGALSEQLHRVVAELRRLADAGAMRRNQAARRAT